MGPLDLEQLVKMLFDYIERYPLLCVALPIWLILAAFFPLRPVFSSLYGPLVRTYVYDTNRLNYRQLFRGIFRVFTTFLIVSMIFSFVGSLIILYSKSQSLELSIIDLGYALTHQGIITTQAGTIDLHKSLFPTIKEAFKVLGIVGTISVATARIFAVLYNTFMIPQMLRMSVTCVGFLAVLAIFDIDTFTIWTDSLKEAFFDAPFYLFVVSTFGFVITEGLLLMSQRFRKARFTPFFLQRQRQEMFELEEQFFSRDSLIQNWKNLVSKEIKRDGLKEICWISFSFQPEQIRLIIDCATQHYTICYKKMMEACNVKEQLKKDMKRSIRLITSSTYYNKFISENEEALDPKRFFEVNYIPATDQTTFIIVNRKIVLVCLPVPHDLIPYSTEEYERKQSSNVGFISRDPERINYYLNRFLFQWKHEEQKIGESLCLQLHDFLGNDRERRLCKYLIAILRTCPWTWDVKDLVERVVALDGFFSKAERARQKESLVSVVKFLTHKKVLLENKNGKVSPTCQINALANNCYKEVNEIFTSGYSPGAFN